MERRSQHLPRRYARGPLLGLFAALLLTAAPCQARPALSKTKPQERVSLPQGTVADSWTRAGFRLGLGFSAGALSGQDGAAGAALVGATIRVGWRLNRRFSLLSTFTYHVLVGDMIGMRYAITLEPTWHPAGGLQLSVGAGYAGIVGQRDDLYNESRGGGSWSSAATRECSGGGVAGLLRAGYLFRLGRVGSSGPVATFFAQGSRCVASDWIYERNADGATVDWWTHIGLSLAWTFLWR